MGLGLSLRSCPLAREKISEGPEGPEGRREAGANRAQRSHPTWPSRHPTSPTDKKEGETHVTLPVLQSRRPREKKTLRGFSSLASKHAREKGEGKGGKARLAARSSAPPSRPPFLASQRGTKRTGLKATSLAAVAGLL